MAFQPTVRTELLANLSKCVSSIAQKKSFYGFEWTKYARISWDGSELKLFSSNYDEFIIASTKVPSVSSGAAVFDPNVLSRVLSKITDDEVTLSEKDSQLIVQGRYRLAGGCEVDSFPEAPEIEGDLEDIESEVSKKLAHVSFAVPDQWNEKLYQIRFQNGAVIATDAVVLAMVNAGFSENFSIYPFSAKPIMRIGSHFPLKGVKIGENGGLAFIFRNDEAEVIYITKDPTVEYPDPSSLFNAEVLAQATVPFSLFSRGVELIAAVGDLIGLELKENEFQLKTFDALGEAHFTFRVPESTGEFEKHLDAKQLRKIVRELKGADSIKVIAHANFVRFDAETDAESLTYFQALSV